MSRYKPYPAYKPSGVAWLGDVPAHWEVKRLRFVAMRSNSNVDKKSYAGQKPVRLCNYTDVYYNERITDGLDFMRATASDDEVRRFSLAPGDVIITKDSEDPHDIGVPAIVSEPLDNVVCGYHLTILRSKKDISPAFLFRVLQSHSTKAHFYVESPGITRFGLSQDALGDLSIPLAPLSEQAAIADFLDRETGRIDALVEKKRRFIELLKEKRQALITAAVTGRFDVRTCLRRGFGRQAGKPYPAYKPSGVEWLGDVPAHWEVMKVGRLFKFPPCYGVLVPDSDDNGVPMMRIKDMEQRTTDKGKFVRISKALSNQYSRTILKGGDVVLSVVGTIGQAFVVPESLAGCNLSRAIARIQTTERLFAPYLCAIIESFSFKYFVELTCLGTAQKVLNMGDLSAFKFAFPTLREQTAIADFLDRETGRIDKLIEKTEQSIELLREKRAALITAAVTGKIDVRECGDG